MTKLVLYSLLGAAVGCLPLAIGCFMYFVLGYSAYASGLVVAIGTGNVLWSSTIALNAVWVSIAAFIGLANGAGCDK